MPVCLIMPGHRKDTLTARECSRLPITLGIMILVLLFIGCSKNSAMQDGIPDSAAVLTESPDSTLDPLREYVKGFAERQEVPGIGLLLARRGRIIFWEAYGFADVDFKKPFRKDTIVFLASSTKPVTATAIMTLVDEGRLSLDDPVSKYLPECRSLALESGKVVTAPTIRQLLSHTSGWAGLAEMSPDAEMAIRNMNLTLADSARRIAAEKLLAEPGTRFSYGGLSFNIAGRVAEVVSGQSFDVFIRQRIFVPLGMADTTFQPSVEQGERVAGIFKPAPWGGQLNLFRFDPDRNNKLLLIGGGLYATARDMAVLLQMHLNGGRYGNTRILSKAAVSEMQKHQIGDASLGYLPLQTLTSYGLGWIRESASDVMPAKVISHSGAFGTVAWIDRERELIGVLFTPMPLKEAHPIHNQIRARVHAAISK